MTDKMCKDFEDHFKNLDFSKQEDLWGVMQYSHSHINAIWCGWQAATLVERERCAVLCETYSKETSGYYLDGNYDDAEFWAGRGQGANHCAHLIRIES